MQQLVVVPLAVKKLNAVENYRTMKRNMTKSSDHSKCIESQDPTCNDTKSADDEAQFEEALKDFMQMRVLDTVYEEDERSWASPDPMVQEPDNKLAEDQSPASQDQSNTEKSTSFRKLLESSPNQLVQSHTRNFQKIEKSTPVVNAFQFLKGSSKSIFSPVSPALLLLESSFIQGTFLSENLSGQTFRLVHPRELLLQIMVYIYHRFD